LKTTAYNLAAISRPPKYGPAYFLASVFVSALWSCSLENSMSNDKVRNSRPIKIEVEMLIMPGDELKSFKAETLLINLGVASEDPKCSAKASAFLP